MHTFSPAKSWILGLQEYRKPLCHLHTQFNQEIPYSTIDMDFMNENQAAHGDREYGHIVSRMGIETVVIDKDTRIREFKNELRWNSIAFCMGPLIDFFIRKVEEPFLEKGNA